MPTIYVRNVKDNTKNSLAALAGSLGVSLNQLINWILDESSMPYDELRKALIDRATEVHSSEQKVYTPKPKDVKIVKRRSTK